MFDMFDQEPQFSDEQRALLVRKIELEIEVNKAKAELLPAMLDAVKNPSPEKDEAISFLSSVKLTSLRDEQRKVLNKLFESAIDAEKLVEMLPAVLMALSHGVNLPLLLRVIDIDPDHVKKLLEMAKKYFSL